jgi:heptosyltransferase II
MNIEPDAIKRILVINLGGIGDVLISTPAVRALKHRFPGSELYFLVAGRVAGAARDLPYAGGVFVFELERPWAHIPANLKALCALRGLKIDLAVNMRTLVSLPGARKIKFLMGLIAPRVKAGRDTAGRGYFFDVKIPEDDIGERYEMEYDIEIVRALGAPVQDKKIDFTVDPASEQAAARIFQDAGIAGTDTVIGIHPGGKPSHRWPSENFAQVLRGFRAAGACKFVITGSRDEARLAGDIIARSGVEAVNLAGKVTLKELAAVLKRCDLFITNDTGSMHIAAIMDTPMIALFGPGYFKRYDPRNISPKAVVLYKKESCSPCNKTFCASVKCLASISVEEVAAAAKDLLTRDGKAKEL